MKKILHLSDLHVGYGNCDDMLKVLIEEINQKYQPASDYVVVITGDIVDNANRKNAYDNALQILNNFPKNGYKLLVVPGNHDYGSGAFGKKKFVKQFKEKFFEDAETTYPKLDIVGKIAFIGVDSMAAALNFTDRFGADGQVGKKQRKSLKKILLSETLEGKKKVVYFHHHLFDGKGIGHNLKDASKIKKILNRCQVDCLLFGHNHDGKDCSDKAENLGIKYCYDGSSSTGKSAPLKPHTPIRVIKL